MLKVYAGFVREFRVGKYVLLCGRTWCVLAFVHRCVIWAWEFRVQSFGAHEVFQADYRIFTYPRDPSIQTIPTLGLKVYQ